MLDMLLCYGLATNMIRAGYLGLVSDLFRQIWLACRHVVGAMAAAESREPSHSGLVHLRAGSESTLLRMVRLEIHVISMI
jgi:hypothetical protein